MIRRFCDECGVEISDYATRLLEGKKGRVAVQVTAGINGANKSGDICEDCIKAAVMAGSIQRMIPSSKQVQP